MKKMVLAGHREEYERYLDENGLTDSDAVYVYDERSFRGHGHSYEIVRYGTYYTHPKYYELEQLLVLNQAA